jgi:hypothetical protein
MMLEKISMFEGEGQGYHFRKVDQSGGNEISLKKCELIGVILRLNPGFFKYGKITKK